MRARGMLGCVIALFVLTSLSMSTLAQTPVPTQRPPVLREFFTVGGRPDHLLLYQENYASYPQLIKDALNTTFGVYQPLFSKGASTQIPFQIVIWATDNPTRGIVIGPDGEEQHPFSSGALVPAQSVVNDSPVADITRVILDDEVCYIRLYLPFVTTTHKEASIAHELAHCYQHFYNRQVFVLKVVADWWAEGSAEWLASTVYPAQYPISRMFRYNRSALVAAYTNLYLWNFIASAEGAGSTEAAMDFLLSVSPDVSTFPDVLGRLNPNQDSTETFHRWMFALIEGRIPFQPEINLPGFTTKVVSGGSVSFNIPRFSGDRAKVLGIKVDPGNKAVVTATALLDNNYAVSAKIGATWVRLPNGRELEFCPQNGTLELLISRGSSPTTAQPDFSLIFTQKESDSPCTPKPDDETPESACITGAWVVTSFPPSVLGGSTFKVDMSEYVYFFHADGTYTGEYDITARPDDGSVLEIDIPFEGTYSVTAVEGSPGRYAVQGFTMALLPGGTASIVTAGGQTSQIANVYYRAFAQYGFDAWKPSGVIDCYEDEMSWRSVPDFDWTLSRLID